MRNLKSYAMSTKLPLLIFALGTVSLLAACAAPSGWGGSYSYNYHSNGERIYYTATSASGQPITYSGSIRMMHSISCVGCHGPAGKGGRVSLMMSSFNVPDITWDNLTREEHEEGPGDGEHEEHPPYTEETLKAAITKGIDPAGERLGGAMPRWKMADQDLDDLVIFIKTLQ